ncbi:glycosyltransferase involved in cell wall biosynthesis [Desulfomicrobium macestii]|uniref:Glycosyltransferase involved in cell wall biosynthesis n=1 Tax=Desulfomicrobium macestii TaxID=90731 RepID=A0ABR9H1C4_9BACT|nr:glycosyltransferase family 4 protein [Desulfomicrobium macestii]MBE1424506.1 glycosyltransferase involved in cell wall biosynthesis [Desulfomicrobium macestii]
MRILHIISQKPDFTGSGKYVQEMIRQGRSRGHEPFLVAGVCADFAVPEELMQPGRFRVIRFDGHDLGFPVMGMSDVMPYPSTVCSSLTKLQIIEYRTAFARVIGSAIADFAPDVIHSNHLWMATAVAREVAPHLPLVTTCHGSCLRQHRLCPEQGDSLKGALRGIDRIIALFGQQKTDIVELLGIDSDRVDVVSGGFNELCFYAEEDASDSDAVQLLYAGKLDSSKGVPWLLRSLKKVEAPWHLHLVGAGSGPEKDLCLELAASHGQRVTVHGVLSHEDLGGLMRRCAVFVLPSFFEGLPLVLLEAMACGCRIVTTDLPGARELFAEPHPSMVRMVELPNLETVDRPYRADEPLLEQRLAEALQASIADVRNRVEPDQDYVRKITGPFTWEGIFDRIESVYRQAIGDR